MRTRSCFQLGSQ